MNNELIEAAENFNQEFLIDNKDLLFQNIEFFEKLFLYLIENKKNKTVLFIFKNFEKNISERIFNIALYHSLTKKNKVIFQYYFKYKIQYIKNDYGLILSLATEHGLTDCVGKLLLLEEFEFNNNGKDSFLKSVYNEYIDIIRLYLSHKNKETNLFLKSNSDVKNKVDFILLKYNIELF